MQEQSTQQSTRRGPGRPRSGRKPRIDITISKDAIHFIDWLIGEDGNLSQFIDEQVKAHPRYREWKTGKAKQNSDETAESVG